MSDSTPPADLAEAYTLIKMGQRIEAGNLLKRYLAQHPQDANAWWLLSHTVRKPDQVKKCLETVLRFEPGHAKARARLDALAAEEAAPPAEEDRAERNAPLPWQQQPAAALSDSPFAPDAASAEPRQTAPTWTPPLADDPFAPDIPAAPPAETTAGPALLDEEPDDSLFFGRLPPPASPTKIIEPSPRRKSKVVQPLSTPPGAAQDTAATPARAPSRPRSMPANVPQPPPSEPSADVLAATFVLSGESAPRAKQRTAPGKSFAEFVAATTIERDPFSGEPVNDPFANIPRTDDPFTARTAAISGTPRRDDEPRRSNVRTPADHMLALAVGVFSVFVLISFVLYALNEGGTISLDIFSENTGSGTSMTTLNADNFNINYPNGWNQRCHYEAQGYQVCGIANHALYNEVDWFAGQEVDIGAMISAAFSSSFTNDLPDEQISIIVMDVPTSSYAYDDRSWAKTLYEYHQDGWVWDSGAKVTYNGREDIIIDGYTAYYYKYTSQGTTNEAAWDVYIPHDGIVFWMRATFSGGRGDRIPQSMIDEMIQSIDINASNPA